MRIVIAGVVLALSAAQPIEKDRLLKPKGTPSPEAQRTFDSWTPEAIASAIPRDRWIRKRGGGGRTLRSNALKDEDDARRFLNVVNGDWPGTGLATEAAGRIMFRIDGVAFVCSGSVIDDGDFNNGRSLVLTAAHCIYDEAKDLFAYDVVFIPKQDDGGNDASDRNPSNDDYGHWSMNMGFVDSVWAHRSWPGNNGADYGFYVVEDTGRHSPGLLPGISEALDNAIAPLAIDFVSSSCGGGNVQFLGYSYNQDPHFKYCDQSLVTKARNHEAPDCGLSGGASGGPVMCASSNGNGPLLSVVSYSYDLGNGDIGNGGPKFFDSTISCIFNLAMETPFSSSLGVVGTGQSGCAVDLGPAVPDPTPSPVTPDPTPSPVTPDPTPAPGPDTTTPEPSPGTSGLRCVDMASPETTCIRCNLVDEDENPQAGDCCGCGPTTGCRPFTVHACRQQWA